LLLWRLLLLRLTLHVATHGNDTGCERGGNDQRVLDLHKQFLAVVGRCPSYLRITMDLPNRDRSRPTVQGGRVDPPSEPWSTTTTYGIVKAMRRDTILIVDDELDVRIFLSTVLEDHGFRAICAEDGAHGLALARSEKPVLICLDISMPHCTGVKMYRELKTDQDLKHIPVVMVTGMPQQFERFIKTRRHFPAPEGYVPKPFVPHQVLVLIQSILRDLRSLN